MAEYEIEIEVRSFIKLVVLADSQDEAEDKVNNMIDSRELDTRILDGISDWDVWFV